MALEVGCIRSLSVDACWQLLAKTLSAPPGLVLLCQVTLCVCGPSSADLDSVADMCGALPADTSSLEVQTNHSRPAALLWLCQLLTPRVANPSTHPPTRLGVKFWVK